jgi:hypothetical protein
MLTLTPISSCDPTRQEIISSIANRKLKTGYPDLATSTCNTVLYLKEVRNTGMSRDNGNV